jgi:hypothetical protein
MTSVTVNGVEMTDEAKAVAALLLNPESVVARIVKDKIGLDDFASEDVFASDQAWEELRTAFDAAEVSKDMLTYLLSSVLEELA